ncbi:hypothetical protein Pmani_008501 [Petrolisthes manimaculis]|uniref:Uncharacterized protein n=1 Tax=Petrolisthes manimaculis TaxID=1843537 RepID=A0AAE1Q6W5_9EUCA|nr:hypothetical protein Pmani_008501 [Petrolisthes manimaculis]
MPCFVQLLASLPSLVVEAVALYTFPSAADQEVPLDTAQPPPFPSTLLAKTANLPTTFRVPSHLLVPSPTWLAPVILRRTLPYQVKEPNSKYWAAENAARQELNFHIATTTVSSLIKEWLSHLASKFEVFYNPQLKDVLKGITMVAEGLAYLMAAPLPSSTKMFMETCGTTSGDPAKPRLTPTPPITRFPTAAWPFKPQDLQPSLRLALQRLGCESRLAGTGLAMDIHSSAQAAQQPTSIIKGLSLSLATRGRNRGHGEQRLDHKGIKDMGWLVNLPKSNVGNRMVDEGHLPNAPEGQRGKDPLSTPLRPVLQHYLQRQCEKLKDTLNLASATLRLCRC